MAHYNFRSAETKRSLLEMFPGFDFGRYDTRGAQQAFEATLNEELREFRAYGVQRSILVEWEDVTARLGNLQGNMSNPVVDEPRLADLLSQATQMHINELLRNKLRHPPGLRNFPLGTDLRIGQRPRELRGLDAFAGVIQNTTTPGREDNAAFFLDPEPNLRGVVSEMIEGVNVNVARESGRGDPSRVLRLTRGGLKLKTRDERVNWKKDYPAEQLMFPVREVGGSRRMDFFEHMKYMRAGNREMNYSAMIDLGVVLRRPLEALFAFPPDTHYRLHVDYVVEFPAVGNPTKIVRAATRILNRAFRVSYSRVVDAPPMEMMLVPRVAGIHLGHEDFEL